MAGAGNLDQGFGTAQYGGNLGKSHYRAYTKYFNRSELPDLAGGNGGDGWHALQGGLRIDSALSQKDTMTEMGGIYTGREGHTVSSLASLTAPEIQTNIAQINLSGGFLQSVWKHAYSERSETNLQVSFDRYTRNGILPETRNTFNADFQHHLAWGDRQDAVWGVGYSFSSSNTVPSFSLSLNPADLSTQLFSGFIQDEVMLIPNRLYVTVGTKLEHNHYTGVGAFPSARLTWAPSDRHMFWGAVSKAGRIPSSGDTGVRANVASRPGPRGAPALISILGNPHFKDEEVLAYEGGYRTEFRDRVSVDMALFYNDYDHQATREPAAAFPEATPAPPHLVLPVMLQNLMHGETHGIEFAANWKLNRRWTLSPGYSFEQIHMHTEAGSQDTQAVGVAGGSSPRHSAQLRCHLELPHAIAWNASAYFVDRLERQNVPGYVRLDTGLDWRWTETFSLSVVGQNLQKDRHLESIDSAGSVNSSLIKRSAYLKFTYRF